MTFSNWPYREAESGRKQTTQAVVFGLGSLFNHSVRGQNVSWERNLDAKSITYRALRDIAVGEELCINYGRLWFQDSDPSECMSGDDAFDDLCKMQNV